ncbi:MAG TPA: hypothetical protein VFK04_11590 [Gemmatimonadaceae bacterium]|jgi:hypothetical protein|nr:hypothetical protein [Gemmatimonadaceae bacterium]
MRVYFSVALLPLLAAAALHAQAVRADSSAPPSQPLPLALVQPSLRERIAPRIGSDSITVAPVDTPSAGEVFARVGLGVAGAGLGGLGAGLLGYALLPHSDCDCDDPGLNEFLIGAAVGTVAGAALAAALPKQRSQCSYGARAVYGVVGALAGGVLGLIPRGNARAITIPLGAAIGAGVSSGFC